MYSKDAGKDQMLMTMERALTSGQKAGFFFLGFLGGMAVPAVVRYGYGFVQGVDAAADRRERRWRHSDLRRPAF